jgi:hypothetical protein
MCFERGPNRDARCDNSKLSSSCEACETLPAAIKPFYHRQLDAPRAIKDSEHPPMDKYWTMGLVCVLSWGLEEEGGIGNEPN